MMLITRLLGNENRSVQGRDSEDGDDHDDDAYDLGYAYDCEENGSLLPGNENGSVKGRDCGSGIATTTDLLRSPSSFFLPY